MLGWRDRPIETSVGRAYSSDSVAAKKQVKYLIYKNYLILARRLLDSTTCVSRRSFFKRGQVMKLSRLCALAVAAAATTFATLASAVPIISAFNVFATGSFVADTGDVTTANTITSGAPNGVGFIQFDNIGLVGFTGVLLSPNPLGMNVGDVFTKQFTTTMGTFLETLTVQQRTPTANALGILATGTIVQTVGVGFDPTAVFWSAAYTQGNGPGTQINGSFNNSTVPPPVIPEPASLALAGLALVGLAASRKFKKA